MTKASYWMSPFRHRTKWEEAIFNGKPHRTPTEYFVADIAPSKAMKRQSVEIIFPAVLMRTLKQPQRDKLLNERITLALEAFGKPTQESPIV